MSYKQKKKTDNWVLEDDKNIRFFFKLFSFHYGLRICTIGNAFLFFFWIFVVVNVNATTNLHV